MIKTPRFTQLQLADRGDEQQILIDGLSAALPHFSPKHFYDLLGSRLFDAITCLPEYYPTRTEASILRQQGEKLATVIPHEAALIDLGAGNCKKGMSLFDLIHPSRYVAVDISVDFLREALEEVQRQHPDMTLDGLGEDFSTEFRLPSELRLNPETPKVFFYPGSSISNFSPEEALVFLKQIQAYCVKNPKSGLLIGVDLVKDKATLEAAYDDALGVTAAFNKNALLNINNQIGSDFALADWAHVGLFNTQQLRIEMHLEAMRDVTVHWTAQGGGKREFRKGDRIHSENSYKWLKSSFEALLREAGFKEITVFTDEREWFGLFWAN